MNAEWAEAKRPNLPSPWTWAERTPHPAAANEIVLTSWEERLGGRERECERGWMCWNATAEKGNIIWSKRMMVGALEEGCFFKKKEGKRCRCASTLFPLFFFFFSKSLGMWRYNEFYIIISQSSAAHDKDGGRISHLRMHCSAGGVCRSIIHTLREGSLVPARPRYCQRKGIALWYHTLCSSSVRPHRYSNEIGHISFIYSAIFFFCCEE